MSWTVTFGAGAVHAIRHDRAPRFTASWATGELPEEAQREGVQVWTDEGHGIEDTIHLFGFEWIDPAPDRERFGRLMKSAVRALEERIAQFL